MGPRTGPRKGARAKRAEARPRSCADQISAITPPELVSGADPIEMQIKARSQLTSLSQVGLPANSDSPKKPAKNRVMMMVSMFLAVAPPMWKRVKGR